MVSTPFRADPERLYPVLYLLDGSLYFGAAAESLTHQSMGAIAPAILVGIGYPTEDPNEIFDRRAFDLTPSVGRDPKDVAAVGGTMTGGADVFIRVIEEEIKPFIRKNYRADTSKQMIWGYSLGGLTVLRMLFRNPGAYNTYIVASPSIWWNDREILGDEATFATTQLREQGSRLKLLITSAGDEQYQGNDPVRRARRMIDNASEMAARLAKLNPDKLSVTRVIFDGETHVSVPPASLSRGLRFALPRN